MDGVVVRVVPLIVIEMGAWSFLKNKHNSVLFSLIFNPESVSHLQMLVNFISNSLISSPKFSPEAKGYLLSANIVIL